MAPRSVANLGSTPSPDTITPDLAMVLHGVKPHPQLGAPAPQPPSTARLGKAAAAIAAGFALRAAAVAETAQAADDEADLAALSASYPPPPGTRARVHRTGPSGVLLLAPSTAPRAVAMAAPGVYVVVEVVR
jgi:hypothetical protein